MVKKFKEFLKEFLKAFGRGLPMSSQAFYKWATLIVFLLAIVGLLLGSKWEGILAISVVKTVCWVIVGMWIGITAYLGQREITKEKIEDYEKVMKGYASNLLEERKKVEKLQQQLKNK